IEAFFDSESGTTNS
ncbi:hypothetical protein, partial [Escherichia coli]